MGIPFKEHYQAVTEACLRSPLVTSSQGGKALRRLQMSSFSDKCSDFELIIFNFSVKYQSLVLFIEYEYSKFNCLRHNGERYFENLSIWKDDLTWNFKMCLCGEIFGNEEVNNSWLKSIITKTVWYCWKLTHLTVEQKWLYVSVVNNLWRKEKRQQNAAKTVFPTIA